MEKQKVSLSIRALLTPNIDDYVAQEFVVDTQASDEESHDN